MRTVQYVDLSGQFAEAKGDIYDAVEQTFGQGQFVGGRAKKNHSRAPRHVPARTNESDAMSKDLKHRGFRFVGSTICYAFMQATGMVNDHAQDCFLRNQIH